MTEADATVEALASALRELLCQVRHDLRGDVSARRNYRQNLERSAAALKAVYGANLELPCADVYDAADCYSDPEEI